MSKKVFNYAGIAKIGIKGPINLLERIAANIEGEIPLGSPTDCLIDIHRLPTPTEIFKDKNFPYLTLDKGGTTEKPTISYTRYDTHVRTIHQESPSEYYVEANTRLDEASGLICARNYLSNYPEISRNPLLHASLITIDGRGILIAGDSRQGKTTSTVYFIEEVANFVGDENIVLNMNEDQARGIYVPRTPRVRFSTIAESGLSKALDDVRIAQATQYIDLDAIEGIIGSQSYYVDAGMAFSRGAFCELLGANSVEQAPIEMVVFPKYTSSGTVTKKPVNTDEGIERLTMLGLERKSDIDPKELNDAKVKLDPKAFFGVEFIELEFSGIPALRNWRVRL